jgi:hypothetical protein
MMPNPCWDMRSFISLVKQHNRKIMTIHYFLCREALLESTLRGDLKFLLDQAAVMFNFVKPRPLKISVFKRLCNKNLFAAQVFHFIHRSEISRGIFLAPAYESF